MPGRLCNFFCCYNCCAGGDPTLEKAWDDLDAGNIVLFSAGDPHGDLNKCMQCSHWYHVGIVYVEEQNSETGKRLFDMGMVQRLALSVANTINSCIEEWLRPTVNYQTNLLSFLGDI